MARVTRGVTKQARHKKIIKAAKGYYGRRKNTFRVANQAVEKAGQYAYRDRRAKKRNYSRFMNGLKISGIELDRKVLADIAVREPEVFKTLADQAQDALEKAA